jgi:hypothetical protein
MRDEYARDLAQWQLAPRVDEAVLRALADIKDPAMRDAWKCVDQPRIDDAKAPLNNYSLRTHSFESSRTARDETFLVGLGLPAAVPRKVMLIESTGIFLCGARAIREAREAGSKVER